MKQITAGISLAGILTEDNFLVIFIALIVAFFLLGILFGRLTRQTTKNPKEKIQAKIEDNTVPIKDIPLGQGLNNNETQQNTTPTPSNSNKRYNRYYW